MGYRGDGDGNEGGGIGEEAWQGGRSKGAGV